MIFNQIKYKWENNNTEITVNILSSMAQDISLHKATKILSDTEKYFLFNLISTHSGSVALSSIK